MIISQFFLCICQFIWLVIRTDYCDSRGEILFICVMLQYWISDGKKRDDCNAISNKIWNCSICLEMHTHTQFVSKHFTWWQKIMGNNLTLEYFPKGCLRQIKKWSQPTSWGDDDREKEVLPCFLYNWGRKNIRNLFSTVFLRSNLVDLIQPL